MSGSSIGLSGLKVAQQAIQIIGNNIANASTEGYHRQEPVISPIQSTPVLTTHIGGGAEIGEVRRMIDVLLEREIRRQTSELGQVNQELTTLQSVEALLGDLTISGLAEALSNFFGSLTRLAEDATSPVYRAEVVSAGYALANQFRALSTTLGDLQEQVVLEARSLAEEVNRLAREIADANVANASLWVRSSSDSNLLDIRDRAAAELADLAEVQINAGQDRSYTAYVWDTPVVLGGHVTEIEVDYVDAEAIGVSVKDALHYETTARGGRLGAMLALYNDLLPRIKQDLDTLAHEIIQRVNQCHVQGLGTAGSFDELTGWAVADSPVGEWTTPVTAGDIHLRVIDTATGEVTRRTVTISAPDTETASDIVALLDAIPNLSASFPASRVRLQAATGFEFDFLPAMTATPATSTLTGTAEPTISGLYEGDGNQTFTCTVVGTGEVGITADLAIEVRDGGGELVKTLSVGAGYPAEDLLEVDDGIIVSLSTGTLNDGEQFTIDALANSDPTGFLAASGLNTFFSGTSAETMDVVERVRDSQACLATALGAGDTDNKNVLRMAEVGDTPIDSLDGDKPRDAYHRMVATVGQWVAVRRARRDGLESITQELKGQREDVSGVDINEEAAKLLIFERMFQSMAKYMATIDRVYDELLELL